MIKYHFRFRESPNLKERNVYRYENIHAQQKEAHGRMGTSSMPDPRFRRCHQGAEILRGKDKPVHTSVDSGSFVVVIPPKRSSRRQKGNQKMYYRLLNTRRHQQRSGRNAQAFPTRMIEEAVRGMIPHTKLATRDHETQVYAGPSHRTSAEPEPIRSLTHNPGRVHHVGKKKSNLNRARSRVARCARSNARASSPSTPCRSKKYFAEENHRLSSRAARQDQKNGKLDVELSCARGIRQADAVRWAITARWSK
jgi:large subunit ribosomal protein L13